MSHLLERLGMPSFRERFPWYGADLQTVRNTLRAPKPQPETGQRVEFVLPTGDRLLARLDLPETGKLQGLVVVLHGLVGGSDDESQRRLARALHRASIGALRLNLRGAGPGRPLARGTYAASCTSDLRPVFQACRRLASELAPEGVALPLGAVGLSLGGTVLLNALLASVPHGPPIFDALVCVSSPLDLSSCAECIERPRNRLYQRWLLRRLIEQTLADPCDLPEHESQGLKGPSRPKTIRAFDDLITAPRWGFPGVMAYYKASSPLNGLRQELHRLPPLLLVHAMDDPWVPVAPALALAAEIRALRGKGAAGPWPLPEVWITARGGHNGFHAPGDCTHGCWSDRLAALWLTRQFSFGF